MKTVPILLLSIALISCGDSRPPTVAHQSTHGASPTIPIDGATALSAPSAPTHGAISEACVIPAPSASAPSPQNMWTQTSPETLTTGAQLIVIGTVGYPAVVPSVIPQVSDEVVLQPVTHMPLHIECILKGQAPAPLLPVRTEKLTSHQATLNPGQRVLVFLRSTGPDSYTVLGEDGVYEITADEASSPRFRFSLPDLVQRIMERTR